MAQEDSKNSHGRLKIIAGADSFGCTLKDTLVAHLRYLNIEVEDLGTDKYYSIASEIGRRISTTSAVNSTSSAETRGLLACGTGVGVSIFANKFPGVYAATCTSPSDALNARSINNSNVLSLSGMSTSPESAIEILTTWLNTPFKSPCPASDSKPWPPEIESFLDNSIPEMVQISSDSENLTDTCAICALAKSVEFTPIDIMPGGSMKILRQTPTSALVRFKAGFKCSCVDDGQFLGHQFNYKIKSGNSYKKISETSYANLTTVDMLTKFNSYDPNNLPDTGVQLNVTVNCSCGNSRVSKDYGLFITYPLRFGENLSLIASGSGLPEKLLSDYNPNSDFSSGSGLVFIPGKDQTGNYPPLKASSSGISGGVIAGVSVAGVVGALFLAACFYFGFYRRKNVEQGLLLQPSFDDHAIEHMHGSGFNSEKMLDSGRHITGSSSTFTGITVDKSVEFSYEELALATDDFSLANKIGQGGFGAVYYGMLRGEKAAIKKMDMQASKEFLAELKVLTHVHHLNLVRLIGYSVESSLFLVYEFIENGNLSEHLRGSSGRGPLSWSSRVQIALDSARGLEYIHEHTVPVYIHRDIKSPNILLDENFRAKVSDFGLTKLTEVGTGSLQTRLVGTFGYMSPEYAQYGDVSPKIDVYAFGVVLYELISAKEAIVKTNEVVTESRGLVALFEEVLNQPNPSKDLRKLVDTRLGDDYPIDSVLKIAQLARACTHENPQLRPSMRSTVVALMTLSSTTEEWDASLFYENQGLVNLMSGR